MSEVIKGRTAWLSAVTAGVVVVAALVWWFQRPAETQGSERTKPPASVRVALVKSQTVETVFEGLGRVVARDEIRVTAEASGRIARVAVADGAAVNKGELLIALETRDEQAAVDAAQARVDVARSEYDRDKQLLKDGHVAQERVDQRRAALNAAQADLKAARVALDNRRIHAPFDGQLSLIEPSAGDYVSPGDPLFTLTTAGYLELEVELPVDQAATVEAGDIIRVETKGGQRLEATVATRSATVDPMGNLVTLKARLDNPSDASIQPGHLLPVAVVTGRREGALVVPEAAILVSGPQKYVFLVDADEMAQRTPVQTGVRRDGIVEVREGLSEGDRVVVDGLKKVRDGQAVRLQGDPSPAKGVEGAR